MRGLVMLSFQFDRDTVHILAVLVVLIVKLKLRGKR
jgi:hypothetical protein